MSCECGTYSTPVPALLLQLRLTRHHERRSHAPQNLAAFGAPSVSAIEPHIDVERPTEFSSQHTVTLCSQCSEAAGGGLNCVTQFPFHLRYHLARHCGADASQPPCFAATRLPRPRLRVGCGRSIDASWQRVHVRSSTTQHHDAPLLVPVGRLSDSAIVSAVTVGVTVLAALLVTVVTVRTARLTGRGASAQASAGVRTHAHAE